MGFSANLRQYMNIYYTINTLPNIQMTENILACFFACLFRAYICAPRFFFVPLPLQ